MNDNLLFFAAFASVTQLDSEVLCFDEVTEVGVGRGLLTFVSFFVVALAVCPIPGGGGM